MKEGLAPPAGGLAASASSSPPGTPHAAKPEDTPLDSTQPLNSHAGLFFLNDRAPPDSSLFPHPSLLLFWCGDVVSPVRAAGERGCAFFEFFGFFVGGGLPQGKEAALGAREEARGPKRFFSAVEHATRD